VNTFETPDTSDTALHLYSCMLVGLLRVGPSNIYAMYEGLGFSGKTGGQTHFSRLLAWLVVQGWVRTDLASGQAELTDAGRKKALSLVALYEQHGVEI